MKIYILRIIIFFIIVASIDALFGYSCRYLNSHAKGGDTKNHYYIAKECDKEVLIFGSSRCMHHYVPQIIEDSLGMSCYNCGVDGNGIVYQYSRLIMMTKRYTPKVVIYDISSGFDVEAGDNTKYLGWQKRYYNEQGIKDVFTLVNPSEKYKMWSNLYRYNGDFIQMLADCIHPMQNLSYGGCKLERGKLDYDITVKEPEQLRSWDPIKKECMIRFINVCKEKNIKVIFTYSPSYGGVSPACESIIKSFVNEYDIPLLNHYSDPNFCIDKDYFYDSVHMNETGATAFTKMLVGEIKEIVQ